MDKEFGVAGTGRTQIWNDWPGIVRKFTNLYNVFRISEDRTGILGG